MSQAPRSNNQLTLADYERGVGDYVATLAGTPSAGPDALARLASAANAGARVLEIGSGPGWDADALEALGIEVDRTDASVAFCDFQRQRGKRCERLDLLSDPVGGPYDGAMMLCVLQHFERSQLAQALETLARALRTGAPLLLMYPEGEGDRCEQGAKGEYRVVLWNARAFDARLAAAGFAIAWDQSIEGRGGRWRRVLARQQ